MKKNYSPVLLLVYIFQGILCMGQEFDYNELINAAQRLDGYTYYLYVKGEGDCLEMHQLDGPPEYRGNYMYYLKEGNPYLRTWEYTDIPVRKVETIHGFDNFIICDNYVPYEGNFYEIWTIGKNSILDITRIDTSVLRKHDSLYKINFFMKSNGYYSSLDIMRRVRDNVIVFTDLNGPNTRIYRFRDTALELMADTEDPFSLYIPGLISHQEPFIIDGILYLHDLEHGLTTTLGKTEDLIDDYIRFTSESKDYLLDARNSIVMPLTGDGRPLRANGVDKATLTRTLVFPAPDTKNGRGPVEFYLYNDKGESALELTITNYPVEYLYYTSTVTSGSRIYISMTNLALVYDKETKEITEVYTSGSPEHGDRIIVFVVPFGGKTNIYMDIHPYFKYSSR